MARVPKLDPSKDRTPAALPETTPYVETVSSAWLAEGMMQMQATMGEVKAKLDSLSTASKEHGKKLDRISHVLFAAGVVLAIGLSIGGFLVNKGFDLLMFALKTSH